MKCRVRQIVIASLIYLHRFSKDNGPLKFRLQIIVGILQVLRFEFLKFKILEILNFHQCVNTKVASTWSVFKELGAYCSLFYGPQRVKTCLWGFANSKGADQPSHWRRLISAFWFSLFGKYHI